MLVLKLTSAVGAGRPAVYVNADQIISFADQAGGCQIKVAGSGTGNNVIAVTETADTVAQKIRDATSQ